MSITCHIFVIHSCPEDRSSAWINIKHSEFPEIPPECFPGVSGRSWTVAFAAVRLCSQPRWSRCTTPSSPLPITRLCIFHQICRSIEEWRMDLTCLCIARRRPCSKLSCNSMEHYGTRFQNSEECGMNEKAEIVWLRKKDVGDVPLLLS